MRTKQRHLQDIAGMYQDVGKLNGGMLTRNAFAAHEKGL